MKKKVDLLLVNPGNRLEQFANLSPLATVAQPLGLAILASYVREQGFTVDIIDAEAEFWTPEMTVKSIEENYEPMMVGLSAFTTKMTAAGKILQLVKDHMPNVLTLAGGHHPSAIPAQTLTEEAVDFVIKGEGFYPMATLLQLLKDGQDEFPISGVWYKNKTGKIIGNGQAKGIQNLNDLPLPAWDLLPMDKYRAHHWQAWDFGLDQSGFSLIFTSLGCPFSCAFCSVNVVYEKNSVRYRSPEHVVRELKYLVKQYGVRHIEIIDDTFTANYKHVENLCDAIIKAGLGDKLNMWCFARTDRTEPAFMNKMKRAGINWVFMGFESGNNAILMDINKKQTINQIRRALENVNKAGIHVGGNFVFGWPEDTEKTMRETFNLALEICPEYANFFIFMAYPGTPLRQWAIQQGFSLPEKWGQYGFFAPDALPVRNQNLTSEDILYFRDNAFNSFYNSDNYQAKIGQVFGPDIRDFLNSQVLTKQIKRTRLEDYTPRFDFP